MKKRLSAAVATILLLLSLQTAAWAGAATETIAQGAKVFNANCAACHLKGGNVIAANKNLKQEPLKQYGMDSVEAIVKQVTNGKNAMPAFKGRLSEEQIQAVANYVLEQSAKGW